MANVVSDNGSEYSAVQVIQFTINILNGIKVPAINAEDIGLPIYKSIVNLTVAKGMLEENEVDNNGREADSE